MEHKTSHDSETAAHGQQVITACALIHKNFDGVEKIFLPKRAGTKKFLPGVYEIPGGHIDYGEDLVEGLKREIKEEFEVDIAVGEPFASFTYTNDVKGSHSVEVIYFATFLSPIEDIKIHPDDHSEFGWFTEAELEKVMTENKRGDDPEIQALKRAFELMSGSSLNFG
ncbi:NUDIX hydrolase [Candidatus Kaiserbacteria bacterium]|nr:NUDIX hydrolase [Candidatus Kaiserbacteria bacterium]USN92612.1 MAG: NUDIX hydrolase [Candidatus Nomurabacteria bacterium]